jgi:hypothetical protein
MATIEAALASPAGMTGLWSIPITDERGLYPAPAQVIWTEPAIGIGNLHYGSLPASCFLKSVTLMKLAVPQIYRSWGRLISGLVS